MKMKGERWRGSVQIVLQTKATCSSERLVNVLRFGTVSNQTAQPVSQEQNENVRTQICGVAVVVVVAAASFLLLVSLACLLAGRAEPKGTPSNSCSASPVSVSGHWVRQRFGHWGSGVTILHVPSLVVLPVCPYPPRLELRTAPEHCRVGMSVFFFPRTFFTVNRSQRSAYVLLYHYGRPATRLG